MCWWPLNRFNPSLIIKSSGWRYLAGRKWRIMHKESWLPWKSFKKRFELKNFLWWCKTGSSCIVSPLTFLNGCQRRLRFQGRRTHLKLYIICKHFSKAKLTKHTELPFQLQFSEVLRRVSKRLCHNYIQTNWLAVVVASGSSSAG
jgi:hypothetical protein